MSKETGGKTDGNLHEGMTDKSAKAVDESMRCVGGSVNSEPTRTKPAEQPPTIGPRVA